MQAQHIPHDFSLPFYGVRAILHYPHCNGPISTYQWPGQPPKLPLISEGSRPHLIHDSESTPKRHPDRFSRFCKTHPCAQQTDRQTDRPRYV